MCLQAALSAACVFPVFQQDALLFVMSSCWLAGSFRQRGTTSEWSLSPQGPTAKVVFDK